MATICYPVADRAGDPRRHHWACDGPACPGKYTSGDLPHLADRLESEAQNELYLFLAQVYRLGFHRLLIYPLRPQLPVRTRRRPLVDRKAGGE